MPTSVPGPFHFRADTHRKVLRVQFSRDVGAADILGSFHQLEDAIALLGAGFTLVTDLTGLERMDIDCVPHLTRMMDASLAAGVGRVVRIIPNPDKDIGFGLLSLTHYRGRVPITTVETRAEAEHALGVA